MADKRISGLTAMTTVSKDDILLIVDDPAGTPTNKKITIEKFFSNVESTITYANITTASNSTVAGTVFKGGIGVVKNVIVDGNVSVNGVFTMTGNGVIANLSSDITPDTTITHDLGNTSASWKDAYVQNLKGHSGTLTVSANTTLSANLITSGANVYVNGTDLTVDANTTLKANLIVHSDSTNTVINSSNTHITSNTILAGQDTTISSNLVSSANLTHTGALGLFDGANLTSNANATFFGNVALGVTAGEGNPHKVNGVNVDTVLLKIGAGNTYSTSNSTLEGTNTVVTSNVTMSGANVNITGTNNYITANTTITANLTTTGANVYINPTGVANVYIKGNITTTGNTSLGDDLLVAGNVKVTDTTQTTSNTTGAVVISGGVGIAKDVTIGGSVNVHGNLHANGNITSDGDLTLGDAGTDTIVFEAYIGSPVIPDTDSAYDLGTTANRFKNIYVDDAVLTGNVTLAGDLAATRNVSGLFGNFTDNVQIATNKSLQLRDDTDTEFIHSNDDGEITLVSATKVTVTTTSLNTSANVTMAGTTANVTANLFIDSAVTDIDSVATTLKGATTSVTGADFVVTANTQLPGFVSNTILITTSANTTLGGSVNISGNVEMLHTANIAANTFIGGHANVRGNVEVAMASVMVGNVTIGTTSAGSKVTIHANNNLIINSNNENEFITIDTKKQEIVSNLAIETNRTLSTANGIYLKDDTSLVFGGQLSLVDSGTTDDSGLLLEDGSAYDSGFDDGTFLLEDGGADRIFSNATGLIFGGDLVFDDAEISSANGVLNLGTYNGLANGVIRISDAYNLPNTAGTDGQFLRLLNGNISFASGTGTNMTDLVQDLAPQLGGPLDTNDKIITNNVGADVVIQGNTSVSTSAGVKLGAGSSFYVFVQESTGRMGINTTSPSQSLDILGTFKAVNDSEFGQNLNLSGHNHSDQGLKLGGTLITSSAAEINVLDGISAALENADLDAVENFEETVSAAYNAGTSEGTVTIKDGNMCLDVASHDAATYGLKLDGILVTSTADELNILDGVTADKDEINILDGLHATTDQLNRTQFTTLGQTQIESFLHTDSENRIDFTTVNGKPGQITVANVVVTGTTTSVSNTTGALKVAGGVGIAKSVNIGQKLTVFGNTTFKSDVTIAASVVGNQIFYNNAEDDLNIKLRVVSLGATTTSSDPQGIGDANNVLVFGNGVEPTYFPEGQAYLYAKDDGVGETHIWTVDEGGQETMLGPHNSDGEWEFYSRNTKTGKVLRINMERMIRKLEEFTGETFIQHE